MGSICHRHLFYFYKVRDLPFFVFCVETGLNILTLNHTFARLTVGRPTEDILLETVSLDRLGGLSLRRGL